MYVWVVWDSGCVYGVFNTFQGAESEQYRRSNDKYMEGSNDTRVEITKRKLEA